MNEETTQPGGGFSSQSEDQPVSPAREASCIKLKTSTTKEAGKPEKKDA